MLTCGTLLAGCASHPNYVRTDGGAVDAAQEQAMLAQCKGEGATAVIASDFAGQRKVTEACMARNGYIQAQ
jgi:hypothetical protein